MRVINMNVLFINFNLKPLFMTHFKVKVRMYKCNKQVSVVTIIQFTLEPGENDTRMISNLMI